MRRAGRIEPGSGDAVLTGQSGFFSPAATAFTNARLSFFVRPFTDGTVTAGTFAAESLPGGAVDAVLEAVLRVESVDEAALAFPSAAAAPSGGVAGGIASIPDAGRASLLAAQASEVASAKEMSMIIEYLFDGS